MAIKVSSKEATLASDQRTEISHARENSIFLFLHDYTVTNATCREK
jgi:hypothetical protein